MSSIDVAAMIPDWSPALDFNDSAVARLVYHYDDADPDASAVFMELLREAAAELVAAERARCAAICAELATSTASMFASSHDAKNANAVAMMCHDRIKNER